MDWKKGAFDSFCVEEAYSWRDDIMEITRQIIHETDEARLTNIAVHFEVDLSEIREFLESKRKQMGKPQTNEDAPMQCIEKDGAELPKSADIQKRESDADVRGRISSDATSPR